MEKTHLILFIVAILLFAMVLPQTSSAQGAGRSLMFDGSTEYVLISDDASLNLTQAFTIEVWAKTTSVTIGNRQVLYCRMRPSSGRGYHFALYSDEVQVGINMLDFESINANLAINTWYHLAGTFDTGTDSVRIYVNGVERLDASTVHQPGSEAAYGPALAKNSTGATDYFGGTLDEVRIWSVARTQTQIRDNMCKKLMGSESDLVGYWRLDESSGTSCTDSSPNTNTGTMTNMDPGTDRVWSGAALGNASSYGYSPTFSVNLAHSNGDDITVNRTAGTPDGAHVYRIDEAPNVTTVPASSGWDRLDPLRYWGVFVVGTATYTVAYDYGGHPGIATEANLRLAKRDNGADGTWEDTGVTPSDGKLTKTDETGTEYILGSTTGDNSLPVEITSFSACCQGQSIVIEWTTESEINNLGFILERSVGDSKSWETIASYRTNDALKGQGNTSSRTEYTFTDMTVEAGQSYYYRLSDVSFQGEITTYPSIYIQLDELPKETLLEKAYPNPFNPQTFIAYHLAEATQVKITVFDILGRSVKQLYNGQRLAGSYHIYWNGTNENGMKTSSGVYIIRMQTENTTQIQKVMFMK